MTRLEEPQSILGYAVGVRIGNQIAEDFRARFPDIPLAAISRGLFDSTSETALALSDSEIRKALEYFDALAREKDEAFEKQLAEIARTNLLKAAEFLEKNAKKQKNAPRSLTSLGQSEHQINFQAEICVSSRTVKKFDAKAPWSVSALTDCCPASVPWR